MKTVYFYTQFIMHASFFILIRIIKAGKECNEEIESQCMYLIFLNCSHFHNTQNTILRFSSYDAK